MATRATIKIVKNGFEHEGMYHHWDGYPEGVGLELENILFELYNDFETDGPETPHDLSIAINKFRSAYETEECQHGDEEFAYLIDLDMHTITCYAVGWDEFEWKKEKIVYVHEF